MATITIKHFDILEYVKKAKEYGIKEEFAEFQARQIAQLADTIEEQRQEIESLKQLQPSTKKDLEVTKLELQKEIEVVRKEIEVVRKEIVQSSNRIIVWIVGFIVASGLIQHFFR